MVDDLVDKIFGWVIHKERSRLLQCTGWPLDIVVWFERFDVRSVECREDVRSVTSTTR